MLSTSPRVAKPHIVDPERSLRDRLRRLSGGRRILVVSNRGPVSHVFAPDGSVKREDGVGGVSIGLASITRYTPVQWIASAMSDADRAAGNSSLNGSSASPDMSLRLVPIDHRAYDAHYNVVCNPLLWLLQHGKWDLLGEGRTMAEAERAWAQGYIPVNRAFASQVLRDLGPEGTCPIVMFHDYHLYLAPGYVRTARPDAILSHFVHIPWPATEAWQQLPWDVTSSILKGLLACDLVGFQTPESAQNFLVTCYSFLQGSSVDFGEMSVMFEGRRTLVRAYPISVDAASLRDRMNSSQVWQYKMDLVAQRAPFTIVKVDRLDPAKNVLTGLRAFDLLLQKKPGLAGQAGLFAFLVPSRQDIPEYKAYAQSVFRLIDNINGRWGTSKWQPVRLFYEHNYDQALAAMALYDVLMVNSFADGMNLVSKEGAVVNERDGVLILSRGAGSFRELGHAALPINPHDAAGAASAIEAALSIPPEERRRRAEALRATVVANDFGHWLGCQVGDLEGLKLSRGLVDRGVHHRRGGARHRPKGSQDSNGKNAGPAVHPRTDV